MKIIPNYDIFVFDFEIFVKKILKITGDLTNKDTCKEIVEKSIQRFGRINVLVNSAGILKPGSLEAMKMEDYEDSMEINVKSVIELTKLCLPHLIAEKGGILNFSPQLC